jgi:biopolymer transport protein ExbD
MAKGRTSNVELNLFPFMSVLICVMGILMFFLIVIVSTRVFVFEPKSPTPPPTPYTGEEGQPVAGPAIPAKQYAAVDLDIRRLTVRLAQREQERQELQIACDRLEDAITAVEDDVKFSDNPSDNRQRGAILGKPEPVTIRMDPGDTRAATTKRPVFVEVQADKFVVHPQKTEYPAAQLANPHSALRKFLDRVDRAREREYLIVLLHPAGVSTYGALRRCLRDNYFETVQHGIDSLQKTRIDIGVEPFSWDWLYVPNKSGDGANR